MNADVTFELFMRPITVAEPPADTLPPEVEIEIFRVLEDNVNRGQRIRIQARIVNKVTGGAPKGLRYVLTLLPPSKSSVTITSGVMSDNTDIAVNDVAWWALTDDETSGQWRVRIAIADASAEDSFGATFPNDGIDGTKKHVTLTASLKTLHKFGFEIDIGFGEGVILRDDILHNKDVFDMSSIDRKDILGRVILHHRIEMKVEALADFNETHNFTLQILRNSAVIFQEAFPLIGQGFLDFDPRKEEFKTGDFKPDKDFDKYAIILKNTDTDEIEDAVAFDIKYKENATPEDEDDFFKKLAELLGGNPNLIYALIGVAVAAVIGYVAYDEIKSRRSGGITIIK